MVNNPILRYINQSSLDINKFFLAFFIKRKISIGIKTIALIAARVMGGTPLSNTILMSGNEKDHIKIADRTIVKYIIFFDTLYVI